MKNLHNIEKSAFRRGEYVGCAKGEVFTITRSTSSYGNWCARVDARKFPNSPFSNRLIYAFTLEKLSKKLEELAMPSMTFDGQTVSDTL